MTPWRELVFITAEEYQKIEFQRDHTISVLVVDGIVVKNRYPGFNEGDKFDIEKPFFHCEHCNQDFKVRQLFLETYIGCMC